MNFYEWVKSPEAEEYRTRREAGEKGNPDNPFFAAMEAYEAGIKEGKRRAGTVILDLIQRG